MSQNLLKRIITSIFLLSLLIFINFSHKYVFVISILIIGLIICLEANNLYSKFLTNKFSQKNSLINKLKRFKKGIEGYKKPNSVMLSYLKQYENRFKIF